jgi:hypothetical protein
MPRASRWPRQTAGRSPPLLLLLLPPLRVRCCQRTTPDACPVHCTQMPARVSWWIPPSGSRHAPTAPGDGERRGVTHARARLAIDVMARCSRAASPAQSLGRATIKPGRLLTVEKSSRSLSTNLSSV